jgi:polyhydroxyalkanoate synthesis repressor PhaR
MSTGKNMAAKRVTIRKYENRRLYDTSNSRYVNLDEVAQMVRDGMDVQVVDATTGEDLTRVVLTQIIVESAKEPDSTLPLDMLRQIVMATGRAGQDGLLRYMNTMFDVYRNAYRTVAPALPGLDFLQAMPGWPPRPAASGPGTTPPPAEPAPPPAPAEPAESDDVRQLRRRVEELERLVSRSTGAGKKKTARSAKPRRSPPKR